MRAGIAGLGVVTPLGHDAASVLHRMAQREHAFAPYDLPVLGHLTCARVGDSEVAPLHSRATAFLLAAAELALRDAGLHLTDIDHVFVGTCSGAMDSFEQWHQGLAAYSEPYAALAQAFSGNATTTFSSACTSGLTALHYARLAIASGLQRVLVVSADAMSAFTASGFMALRSVAADRPLPFHPDSLGLGFGEGAAAVVLTAAPQPVHCGNSALTCDAFHRTKPRPDARALRAAVERAVGDQSIDVYVAHGTGTPANDGAERELLTQLGWLDKPVLAHKGFIGHAMGASGLISFALAAQLLRQGGGRYEASYDPAATRLRLRGELHAPRRAVVVAAAFGGANAAAVVQV